MPIFYVTAGGVVFDSAMGDEPEQTNNHDSKNARDRLTEKLAELKLKEDIQNNGEIVERTEVESEELAELAVNRMEDQLRANLKRMEDIKNEQEDKKLLARLAHTTAKRNNKAISSQFVYQPNAADNAEKRAIVHHTGSHYHMAGSKQFQKGLRVKGVISRHSQQGAKMQAARVAKKQGLSAREDARGERSAGGKSVGKSTKKKKKSDK
jgi:hypothetical protein